MLAREYKRCSRNSNLLCGSFVHILPWCVVPASRDLDMGRSRCGFHFLPITSGKARHERPFPQTLFLPIRLDLPSLLRRLCRYHGKGLRDLLLMWRSFTTSRETALIVWYVSLCQSIATSGMRGSRGSVAARGVVL